MLASRERSFTRAVEDFDRVIALGRDRLQALVPGSDLYLVALVALVVLVAGVLFFTAGTRCSGGACS